ncbi:MAG: 4-hydroxythreonine-4-phosphate dehydrogenase PdxA [Balneolales bacterium]
MKKPVIGISMGDPSGIGPEICVKAAFDRGVLEKCNPVVVGNASIIRKAMRVLDVDKQVNVINKIDEANFSGEAINVVDLKIRDDKVIEYGQITAEAGSLAFHAVKKVIEMAMDGEIDATVTAPIHKESINLAGHNYAGHTEIYAEFTNTPKVAMLLVDGDFRIIHVSTHVALRKACDLVKKDRILHVISLMNDACIKFGIVNPKIAVCGLNPHASDGGLFGHEEQEEIIPAIKEAFSNGINAEGPYAADTIMSKVVGGFYDGCVAMYHDQGHIPFKVKGFVWDREKNDWGKIHGVNITLGIPIIRVSVDHGTAFDIAGKGIASCDSMIHAIEYAIRMSANKNESDTTGVASTDKGRK